MAARSDDRYRPLVEAFDAIVSGGAPAGRQSGGAPAGRQSGGAPAGRQSGGAPAGRQSGGAPAGRQSGGAPAALVVRRGSEVVVEAAAGTDADGRAFTSTTPVFLYSAVKPMAALSVVLACADGALDLDVPVASLWPGFGVHGKDRVTVAQALAHGAAVPGWRDLISISGLADRPAAAEALAASEPWWRPGEPGEHAWSYGHLLDGVLRHATGRDISYWWGRTVATTGVDIDLVAGSGVRQPAPLEDPGRAWLRSWEETSGHLGRVIANPAALLDVDVVNSAEGRTLVAPAITGYGSAADLAALWSWWPNAAVESLGGDLHARLGAPVLNGYDHVLERQVSWGLGPQFEPDGSYGMGGIGGCVGWYEPALDLSIGFTTPQVGPPERLDPLDGAILGLRAQTLP